MDLPQQGEAAPGKGLCQQAFHILYSFLPNTLPHDGAGPSSLQPMNIRVALRDLNSGGLNAARLTPAHRTKFNPRAGILDEVVAGLLWMALDLPQDVSRPELESFAHQLVARIRFGASETMIESEIAFLQSDQLGRPANHDAIHGVAGRVMNAVRGF